MDSDALGCPQCGAALEQAPDEGSVECSHCGARLLVTTIERRHDWVPESLGPREAKDALVRELSERESGGAPEIREPRLVFFPFTRSQGPHGPRLTPAAPPPLEDLRDYRHSPGDRRGFLAAEVSHRGEVIPARSAIDPSADLLHVPFYVTPFRLAGSQQEREAWVDALSGRVLFEAPPPTREQRLDGLYAALVASVFLAMVLCARLLWTGGLASLAGAVGLAACVVRGRSLVRAAIRRAEAA